jgi:hypothetical protein
MEGKSRLKSEEKIQGKVRAMVEKIAEKDRF